MPDDPKTPVEAGTAPEGVQHTPEETQVLIKSLREEAKANRIALQAAQATLTQREKDDQTREQKRLEEQGEFKKLYETSAAELARIKAEAERAAQYQGAFQQTLDARIAAIPEAMRSLVPEGLDPLALSQWLDKNARLLTSRPAPNLDPGSGISTAGSAKPITLTAEQTAMANAMGLKPEIYAARLAEAKALRGQT